MGFSQERRRAISILSTPLRLAGAVDGTPIHILLDIPGYIFHNSSDIIKGETELLQSDKKEEDFSMIFEDFP